MHAGDSDSDDDDVEEEEDEDEDQVPILPNIIFQILHMFVRFSHKYVYFFQSCIIYVSLVWSISQESFNSMYSKSWNLEVLDLMVQKAALKTSLSAELWS
jgi:hypothetical protein